MTEDDFKTYQRGLFAQIENLYKFMTEDSMVSELHRRIQDRKAINVTAKITNSRELAANQGPGFYVFYIKPRTKVPKLSWLLKFEEDWLRGGHDEFQHSPAIVKKRKVLHKEPKGWVPLYLGKSEHVAKRVVAHFSLPGNKKTFSLKLQARSQALREYKIQVRVFTFAPFKGMQIYLENMERHIREKFIPLTGRQ